MPALHCGRIFTWFELTCWKLNARNMLTNKKNFRYKLTKWIQLISACCSKLIASLWLLSYRRDYNNIFSRLNLKEGTQYIKILRCIPSYSFSLPKSILHQWTATLLRIKDQWHSNIYVYFMRWGSLDCKITVNHIKPSPSHNNRAVFQQC